MPIKGLNQDPLPSETVRAIRAGLKMTANELASKIAVTPRTVYAWETEYRVTYRDKATGELHEAALDPDPIEVFRKERTADGKSDYVNEIISESGDKRCCTGPARILLQHLAASISEEDLPEHYKAMWIPS